jgi:integrase
MRWPMSLMWTYYINRAIIPALCAKAGVPTADVRGNITSHRARSTIATQLYNGKEPMTLFELQAWLGHKDPATTQNYAKITPNTLTKAYTQAGYFARNLRTIEVLLSQPLTIGRDSPRRPEALPRYLPAHELEPLMTAINGLENPMQRAALLLTRWSEPAAMRSGG